MLKYNIKWYEYSDKSDASIMGLDESLWCTNRAAYNLSIK
jgi:hypothetical protein